MKLRGGTPEEPSMASHLTTYGGGRMRTERNIAG